MDRDDIEGVALRALTMDVVTQATASESYCGDNAIIGRLQCSNAFYCPQFHARKTRDLAVSDEFPPHRTGQI